MLANNLLHPDHVVPSAKLVPTLMEAANLGKPSMGVEISAVGGQVFIRYIGIPDTGIQIQDAHVLKRRFQGRVQLFAQPLFLRRMVKIDRQLAGLVVCRATDERPGIGIALDEHDLICIL